MINYSKNFEKNILLVGNGFDLAQGFKTSYGDFIKYVFLISYLSRIKSDISDNPNYKNFIFSNLDNSSLFDNKYLVKCLKSYFNRKALNSYSVKLLSLKFNKDYFDKTFNKEKLASNSIFQSFNEALFSLVSNYDLPLSPLIFQNPFRVLDSSNQYEKYLKEGGENNLEEYELKFQKKLFSNSSYSTHFDKNRDDFFIKYDLKYFLEYINKKIQLSSINNWLDVENFIKLFVVGGNELKEQFGFSGINSLINFNNFSQPKILQTEIDLFASEFVDYLRLSLPENCFGCDNKSSSIKKKQNKHNVNIFKKYNFYLKEHYSGFVDSIDLNNITDIINYNYTSTPEYFFSSKNIKFYYVNGKIEKQLTNSKAIHNKENNPTASAFEDIPHTSVVFGISDLENKLNDERLYIFEKKYLRQKKNIPSLPIKDLTSNAFNLVIYGHSCGLADADVLKPLLTSNNLKTAIILCYNEPSRISISDNLIKIIGKQKFYQMLENASNKKTQALCFSIHEDNI